MKLIISSAFAAALVSSASANCADIGNSAAGEVMMANGCFPTAIPNTSGSSCDDTPYAIEICEIYIDREFSSWCSNVSVSRRRLKNQCPDYVLQSEESGAEEEVVFSEDSGENEDEDAPVQAVDTYLRARCGKYTGAIPAAQAAVNIVDDIWRSSGERCGYANSGFTGDAERALHNEFPDYCHAENAIRANQGGRRAGENKINQIVSSCSRPVPSPSGCSSWDYNSGVKLTKRLQISCRMVDFGNLEIQQELANRNANDCVQKGAWHEFDRIKRNCRKEEKSVGGNKSGKNGKDLEIE